VRAGGGGWGAAGRALGQRRGRGSCAPTGLRGWAGGRGQRGWVAGAAGPMGALAEQGGLRGGGGVRAGWGARPGCGGAGKVFCFFFFTFSYYQIYLQ
jgi:hypothetical protein